MANDQNFQTSIKKVVLDADYLCAVATVVSCPEEGCGAQFRCTSNLSMHLLKRHHKQNLPRKSLSNVQFFCPESGCKYHENGGRHFASAKQLKQHYLKVHAQKNFICDKCNKGFSTRAFQISHSKVCGVNYPCSCGLVYTSLEALLTHTRRKQHRPLHQAKGKTSATNRSDCHILPYQGTLSGGGKKGTDGAGPVHLLAAVALSELSRPITNEAGIQTEPCEVINRRARKSISPGRAAPITAKSIGNKRRTSTHTQTVAPKRPKMSTETQTVGDAILQQAMEAASIPVSTKPQRRRKTSMQTQTWARKHSTQTQTSRKQEEIPKKKQFADMTIQTQQHHSVGLQADNAMGVHSFQSVQVLSLENSHLDLMEESCHDQRTLFNRVDSKSSENLHAETQNELKNANLTEIECDLSESLNRYPTTPIVHDVSLPELWLTQKSTQTSPTEQNLPFCSPFISRADETRFSPLVNLLSDDKFQSSETQTELAEEFNGSFLHDCDTNFALCSHIETQTSEEELHQSIEQMLHSNMYTQTCDDLLLDFADIQTQTAWPESYSNSDHVSSQ